MPLTTADLRTFATQHRVHAECIGVGVFALVTFALLGMAAHRRVVPAQAARSRVGVVAAEIADFRAAFKASTPDRDAAAVLPDSFAVGVTRDMRVSIAQRVASSAELAGLSDVRVKFTAPDSAAAPDRPDFFGSVVSVADYGISIDASGSFANVLSLVTHLPPSVALQRIVAVREKNGSHFRVVLAVFEAAGSAQHG